MAEPQANACREYHLVVEVENTPVVVAANTGVVEKMDGIR